MTATHLQGAIAAALLLAVPQTQAASFNYTCELLDQHTDQGYGWALNEAGKVAGLHLGASRWSRTGRRADLEGVIPGETSEAYGINGAGLVVGYSGINGFPGLPTVWNGRTATTLPLLPGGADGFAETLNDTGLIAGSSTFDGGSVMHGVVWQDRVPVHLGALGSGADEARHASYVSAMNQAGEMVGSSEVDDERHRHAVYWGANRKIVDLGTVPGHGESGARGISETGTIVGYSLTDFDLGDSLPVVWIRKAIQRLPLQPGQKTGSASAINASGQIVGRNSEHIFVDGARFPFYGTALLWPNARETPIDLNTVTAPCIGRRKAFLAERLIWTSGINDKGMILAEFQGLAGRSYYLRPAVLRPVK